MKAATGSHRFLAHCSGELERARHIWVGYSGGMDSTLLLKLVSLYQPSGRITALHVNHGIHADADRWQAHCSEQAERLAVKFEAVQLELGDPGNLEEQARQERYRVFAERLQEGDLLLLAHHADDQAETLLFRLVRGAGLRGLAAMPVSRPLGCAQLLRPLLELTRKELLEEAEKMELTWVEDPSNLETRYSRNFLRHRVLAPLVERWPGAIHHMAAAALRLRESQQLLEDYGWVLAKGANPRAEIQGISFCMRSMAGLQPRQRQLLLRTLLAALGLHPDSSRLDELMRQLLEVDEDNRVFEDFGTLQVSLFQQRIYLLQLSPVPASTSFDWNGAEELTLPGLGCLQPLQTRDRPGDYRVCFRQGGERCVPLGRAHSQSLKHYFQDSGVPPWLRERTPLIYRGDKLVGIAGLTSCHPGLDVPGFIWAEAGLDEIRKVLRL